MCALSSLSAFVLTLTCLLSQERELLKLKGNVQKYQMIRTYTFKEVVETEEGYVKDLDTLQNARATLLSSHIVHNSFSSLSFFLFQVFLKPMKAVLEAAEKERAASHEKAPVDQSVNLDLLVSTFNNIQEMRTIHAEFAPKLREKMDQWSETTEVAQLFIDFVSSAFLFLFSSAWGSFSLSSFPLSFLRPRS